jgi:hypothetical protein
MIVTSRDEQEPLRVVLPQVRHRFFGSPIQLAAGIEITGTVHRTPAEQIRWRIQPGSNHE